VFPHVLQEIVHFFTIYKELEDKKTVIKGWLGPRETRQAIVDSRNRYLKKKKTRSKSK
jgi:inorganic pyrophosphatase